MDRTVDECAEEFHKLVSRNNMNELEEQLVLRFTDGLTPAIAEPMGLAPIFIVAEACCQASLVKKKLKK